MPAVKALVFGLGVLLLAGIALLVYGIVQKAADPKFKLLEGRSAAGAAAAAFGETSLALPEGCVFSEIRPDGARLYLRVGPAGACERILVIDSMTGRPLGSIRPRP